MKAEGGKKPRLFPVCFSESVGYLSRKVQTANSARGITYMCYTSMQCNLVIKNYLFNDVWVLRVDLALIFGVMNSWGVKKLFDIWKDLSIYCVLFN